MSLWWQNNPSFWISWTISIPMWVSIFWHAAWAPSDAKLLEGGVHAVTFHMMCYKAHAKAFQSPIILKCKKSIWSLFSISHVQKIHIQKNMTSHWTVCSDTGAGNLVNNDLFNGLSPIWNDEFDVNIPGDKIKIGILQPEVYLCQGASIVVVLIMSTTEVLFFSGKDFKYLYPLNVELW